MSKRKTLIILALLFVIGSFVTFYGTNCFMSDVANMFNDAGIITSIPILMVCCLFVLATIFVIRFYRYPQYKKALINYYTIFAACLSFVGFVTTILGAITIYHSFVLPHPFFGYSIIMLVLHALIIASMALINIKCRKTLPEDSEKKKIKFKYVLYSILLCVLTYLSYNKLGAFFFSFIYMQWSTLYMTFPLYLSLLLPAALLIHVILYFMDAYKGHEIAAIVYVADILILNIALTVAIAVTGANEPQFISAVSPALPLERLMTFPLDTIVRFSSVLILSGYYLFYAIRTKKLSK